MAKAPTLKPQEVEQLITAYEQSGLSTREFCERENLRPTTFDYYRTKRRKQLRAASRLVKVELTGSAPAEHMQDGFILWLMYSDPLSA